MSRKLTILGLAAAAVISGSAMTAQAATVNLILSLQGTDGTPIAAGADGKYLLAPGQGFNVLISLAVANPNISSGSRPAATQNRPLGVGNLSTTLITDGALLATPVVDSVVPQPRQDAGASYIPVFDENGLFAPAFVNINDVGGDGDPDIQGTGYGVSPGNAINAGQMAKFQFGATGVLDLITHAYVAQNGAGELTIRTQTSTANVFVDTGSSFAAQGALTGLNEGSLVIVVPEPATMGLLSTGALAFLARRRRA